jgi:hypothetical protein
MNAIELLIDQHRMLEAHLQAAIDATQPHARAALLVQASERLAVHIASEEEVFYPAIKARHIAAALLESLEEHSSLQRLVAELLELPPAEPAYTAKLEALKQQTELHHREEEVHLFPKALASWDPQQLDVLGRQMMRLQHDLRAESVAGATPADHLDAVARLG